MDAAALDVRGKSGRVVGRLPAGVDGVNRARSSERGEQAVRPDPSPEPQARRLHREVVELRGEVLRQGGEIFDMWRPGIKREEFLPSARNLAHYMALRRHDLRDLQVQLMPWGLSSLGRCEARVLANLNAVAAALAALGMESGPEPGPDTEAYFRGHELLSAHTEAVLGPTSSNRAVRIMVTLPTQAAHTYELVRELVSNGMDVARVNCAHDDSAAWAQMAEHVRRASREIGRPCRICFDLVGPRARVASTTLPYERRVHLGERILMTSSPTPVRSQWTHQFECSLPEVLDQLRYGARVFVNEGRLGAVVEHRQEDGVLLRVVDARDKGEHLRTDKGLNFPDTELRIDPLGPGDLTDLDVIAPLADAVGYSFVQRPEEIIRLQAELASRGQGRIGLVAKIETRLAVKNLPELIVQGAGVQPLAIMIARGDLAVELGHRRMAEIQEELLWVCEAAHVPVIWATQVLDNFVKNGVRHRGEMTDAAMAERAECVMLNKGPFAADAVRLLDDLLGRMEGHQFKKASRMRALRTWASGPAAHAPAHLSDARPRSPRFGMNDPDGPEGAGGLSFIRDLPLTRASIEFAQERHGGQRRLADGAPFVLHPLEVASLLERSHYPDHVVAAAVLHDVLEDTDAERSELESRFGPDVSELVALVSDDPSIPDEEERKDDIRERVRHAGGYAPVVYAADKVSKVRELRILLLTGFPEGEAEVKRERYQKSLAMLEETIPGSRVVELLRFELEALEKLPPHGEA